MLLARVMAVTLVVETKPRKEENTKIESNTTFDDLDRLKITIDKATLEHNTSGFFNKKMDPYVNITLSKDIEGKHHTGNIEKTKPVNNSHKNPVWDESFFFRLSRVK